MVEAKLESLINRLEKAAERHEAIAAGLGGGVAVAAPSGGGGGAGLDDVCKNFIKLMEPKIAALRAKT